MSIQLRNGLANQSVDLVLEDLLVRFLVNCPTEDLSSIERVFFQVEEAQWFYTDFVRQMNPSLPSMKMKAFSAKFLKKCPLIWKWGDPSDAISRFGKYKSTIPVRGIACFNKDMTKLLLVKGTESNSWSFPRGKISKDESDIDCAIREADEEIGFDVRELISEQDVIERTVRGKNYKIYLIRNVDENYPFTPKSRNEISAIKWHDIKTINKKVKSNPNSYFLVGAMWKPVIKWINSLETGITNEAELMYEAELKLKKLLGISNPQENVDAGRELLNILQGVVRKEDAPTIQVPQNLQMPFQFPNFLPYQQHNIPIPTQSMYPPLLASPFHTANSTQNLNLYPQNDSIFFQNSPQTLQKLPMPNARNTETSRELLSILNARPTKKDVIMSSDTSASNSNRSKAQNLLSLFKKDRNSTIDGSRISSIRPSQENSQSSVVSECDSQSERPAESLRSIIQQDRFSTREPSNELEESLSKEISYAEPDKKIKILKRSQNSKNSNANDLLGLLKSPNQQIPKVKTNSPIVAQNTVTNQEQSQSQGQIQPQKIDQPLVIDQSVNSSNELLSLLKSKPVKSGSPGIFNLQLISGNQRNKTSQITVPSTEQKKERKHSNTLLELLKPKQPQQSLSQPKEHSDYSVEQFNLKKPHEQPEEKQQEDSFENFEDFEDFEDFGGLESDFKSRFDNFDIASDEEDVDHILDSMVANRKSQVQEPLDLFQERDQKNSKIRLLKPSQNINESLQFDPSLQNHQDANKIHQDNLKAQSQSILAALHGNKSPLENVNAQFQPFHDSNNSMAQSNQVLNSENNSNRNSAAFFMDLLNK